MSNRNPNLARGLWVQGASPPGLKNWALRLEISQFLTCSIFTSFFRPSRISVYLFTFFEFLALSFFTFRKTRENTCGSDGNFSPQ